MGPTLLKEVDTGTRAGEQRRVGSLAPGADTTNDMTAARSSFTRHCLVGLVAVSIAATTAPSSAPAKLSNIHTAYLFKWTQQSEFPNCVAGHGFWGVLIEHYRIRARADQLAQRVRVGVDALLQ